MVEIFLDIGGFDEYAVNLNGIGISCKAAIHKLFIQGCMELESLNS